MKMAIVSDNARWVLDSIAKDYAKYSSIKICSLDSNPDLIWVSNYWSAAELVKRYKNVVVQLHHVSQEKIEKYDFSVIDKCLACIVPNDITFNFIRSKITTKLVKLPYWILSERMQAPKEKRVIGGSGIYIGSFQKDSNGNTDTPKLEKGPDIFVDIIKKLKDKTDLTVVLSGYARKYIVGELIKNGIPYKYFERDSDINGLYDVLDWYLVTSRHEGGPQAILEASYRKVKILSTDVGIAPEVLHPSCICYGVDEFVEKIMRSENHIDYNFQSAQKYIPENIIPMWDKFFVETVS